MGQKWDSYQADELIKDVTRLLEEHGVNIDLSPERAQDRLQGAVKLLSGLGVVPTLPPEQTLDLDGHRSYNARIHGD